MKLWTRFADWVRRMLHPWAEAAKWRRRAEEETAFSRTVEKQYGELQDKLRDQGSGNRDQGSEPARLTAEPSLNPSVPRPSLPGLSAAEVERLALLMEECGEVAQAAAKVLRYGYGSIPNGRSGRVYSNRVVLERELGNLWAVIDLLIDAKDVRRVDLATWAKTKRSRLAGRTRHQPSESGDQGNEGPREQG